MARPGINHVTHNTNHSVLRYGAAPLLPPQPNPRSYSSVPPPADPRWRQAGSLVSSHAAVCIWGSCNLLIAQAQEEEAKRQRLASMAAKGASKGALASWDDQVRLEIEKVSRSSHSHTISPRLKLPTTKHHTSILHIPLSLTPQYADC